MKFKKNLIALISMFLLVLAVSIVGYWLFQRQMVLEQQLHSAQKEHMRIGAAEEGKPHIIEKVVSKSQLWRPVQEKIKDTVVQVFSQIASLDLLQPYKTPAQNVAYGSGFFISEQGELITNAHVVDQAKAIWIQIPSLGKRIIDVDIVGVSPDRDLALLKITEKSLDIIRKELGAVPFLSLGDSDLVYRSDEVMALGYPLGQQSLKSTTGVVSGREYNYIQISAPINPGSSGGPLLNMKGEVVGINSASVTEAQNVGYAIPINDLKNVLPDLHTVKLLRKPFLGILYNNATNALTEFLGNPAPGGTYVIEVVKDSTLDKAGVKTGDMIYEINGYPVDIYGDMAVPWSEDKLSIMHYVSRLSIGEDVHLVAYRSGQRKEFAVKFSQVELPAIHRIYPGYEDIDFEVFAGMVVMELTLNHINLLSVHAPGLAKYGELQYQAEPVLIVTHIFPNSELYRTRTITVGSTLNEINGMKVRTLADYRNALKKGMHGQYFTIRSSDNVLRASDNVFSVLDMGTIIEQESKLAQDYKYPLSETVKEILRVHQAGKAIGQSTA